MKRKYTEEQLEKIIEELRAITVDGQPVFEVEERWFGDKLTIVLSNWATVANLEWLVKRYSNDE